MTREAGPAENGRCPFLHPVIADRLWLVPVGCYCRRPGRRVRVPSAATLASVCGTASYHECPGYLDSTTWDAWEGRPP